MARKPNTKMIGLFMLIGIISFVMIIGTFVVQRFSGNKEDMLIMYFEESIKGLNVGSSVLFKGVEIGKVAKIEIIADTSTLSFSIPVFVKINNYQKVISKDGEHQENQRLLNELIEKGLRARLISQSYLTGQLAIELEMFPDTPIILKNNDRFKGVLEIPTILSPMGALSKDLTSFVRQIKELHEDDEEQDVSIGIERVLGLYKISNARRWYDKVSILSYALKTMSTLPKEDFYNINNELKQYSEKLSKRKQIIVANKIDIMQDDAGLKELEKMAKKDNIELFKISGVTGDGVTELLDRVTTVLKTLPKEEMVEETEKVVYTLEEDDGKQEFTVRKEGDTFIVEGKAVNRLMGRINIDDNESMYYFQKKLKELGIEAELKKQGICEGDYVKMLNWTFEWYE